MASYRVMRRLRWFLFFAAQALAAIGSGHARLYAQAEGSAAPPVQELLVPIATRRLPRGTVLRESDMTVARAAKRGPAVSRPTPVEAGWITRRVVLMGEELRQPAVAPAPLVVAGQAVQFTYVQDGLRLTLDGIATSNALLGETVDVRLGAKRRVTGRVSGRARITATDSSRIS